MKKILVTILTLGLLAGSGLFAADEKLDLESILRDKESLTKSEMEEAGTGDHKQFKIKTDADISAVEVGDVYKNDEKTFFKVANILNKSSTGGAVMLERLNGATDPGKKLSKVSGNGPAAIVVRTTLIDLYIQGGVFLHPIAFLFVVMIVLLINSMLLYRKSRQCPDQFVAEAEKALLAGEMKQFEELANKENGMMAHVCRAMVYRLEHSSLEDIKHRVEVAASKQVSRLRIPVKAMNLIAVAAPLLGLLGTIVGMVIVFEAVAGTTGAAKASALAAGIRVKLFSTATALIVAIPALFIYFIFNQKLSMLVADCEIVAERFLHLIALRKRGADAKSAEKW
jgi:biopolymer transport protein ExbB/TolQ